MKLLMPNTLLLLACVGNHTQLTGNSARHLLTKNTGIMRHFQPMQRITKRYVQTHSNLNRVALYNELEKAFRNNDIVLTEALLREGACIEHPSTAFTLLHAAASRTDRLAGAFIELFLDYHADINSRHNPIFATPLHFAAFNGNPRIVALLLVRGADISIKNSSGRTAAEVARDLHYCAIADFIEGYKPSDELTTLMRFRK